MSNSKIFERLKRKRFFSIGRAGMDFYAEPPGTEFEQANNFSAHIGGSAGNIAVALAKLDCELELVTCFSDDAVGRFTAKSCTSLESAHPTVGLLAVKPVTRLLLLKPV